MTLKHESQKFEILNVQKYFVKNILIKHINELLHIAFL